MSQNNIYNNKNTEESQKIFGNKLGNNTLNTSNTLSESNFNNDRRRTLSNNINNRRFNNAKTDGIVHNYSKKNGNNKFYKDGRYSNRGNNNHHDKFNNNYSQKTENNNNNNNNNRNSHYYTGVETDQHSENQFNRYEYNNSRSQSFKTSNNKFSSQSRESNVNTTQNGMHINRRSNYRNSNNNQNNNTNSSEQRTYYNRRSNKDSTGSDTKHRGISVESVKYALINFIYDNVDIGRYTYSVIDSIASLKPMYDSEYYATPNYNGSTNLLVFTKLGNNYYSFMLNRRNLSYKKETLKIEGLTLETATVRLGIKIYDGTVFDGTLISSYEGDRDIFIINDAYMFEGKDITDMKINIKMVMLSEYLNINYKKDKEMNTLDISINSLYKLEKINDMLIDVPNKATSKIKGIDFVPELSGNKLVFLYSQQQEMKTLTVSCNDKALNAYQLINSDTTATFRIKRKADEIYLLYLGSREIISGRKLIRYVKQCTAFLPTVEASTLCNKLYLERDADNILVDCVRSENGKYWIPIKQNKTKKYPDLVSDVYKK